MQLKADPVRGKGRVLGAEIVGQLVNDLLVTARLELRRDDPLGIGFGGVPEQTQTLRRPLSLKTQATFPPAGAATKEVGKGELMSCSMLTPCGAAAIGPTSRKPDATPAASAPRVIKN